MKCNTLLAWWNQVGYADWGIHTYIGSQKTLIITREISKGTWQKGGDNTWIG